MDENYSFEDKMKELLEEEREHRFEPAQWRRLSRRLKTHDQPSTNWRWAPYALALLLGLLSWQLWQQQVLRQSITDLNSRLADLHEQSASDGVSVESRTVVVYDTIYQRTVVQAPQNDRHSLSGVVRPGTTLPSVLRFTDGPIMAPTQLPTSFLSGAQDGFQAYRQTQLRDRPEKNVRSEPIAPYFINEGIPTSRIRFLALPAMALPALPVAASASYEYPRASVWQRLNPKSYTVSVGGGKFRSWAYGNDDDDPFADLNVEVSIGKSFSLDLGTAYLQRSFSAETEDGSAPTDLPRVTPRNPGDELEGLTGRVQRLQFPVGIKYYPWQGGRFRAFLGAGLAPLLGLPSSFVRYEYEDDDEAYTLNAPNVVSTRLRAGAVYGSFGLQTVLGNHWHLGLRGTVQQPLGTYAFDYQKPHWGRWRLGVGYHLSR